MRRKRRNKQLYRLLFLFLLMMTIGYAALTSNLSINGIAEISNATWDIHFENIQVTTGSITPDSEVNIDTDTSVSYEVTLSQPGDFYEFTVDVVNDGSVDAMIEAVVSRLNNNVINSTNPIPSFLSYSVAYSDGYSISPNHLLEAGEDETYRVRIAFRTDINPDDLPSSDVSLELNFEVTYIQADENATPVPRPDTFENDSLDIIINAVRNGDLSKYHVGDTKTITLTTYGDSQIRISNMSTPEECNTPGFSQTACGFVLEFVNTITTRYINYNPTGTTNGTGNKGGWEYCYARSYLNSTIFNNLPQELKSAIIPTTVVSGHGNNGDSNFVTTDKLYLLSPKELAFVALQGDIANSYTRALDYYTNADDANRIKKNNNNYAMNWWLRSPYYVINQEYNQDYWYYVNNYGHLYSYTVANEYGLSPAFRIG